MEFLGLHIAGAVILLLIGWYLGKNWTAYNSVSDIELLYKNAADKLSALKANVATEAKAAEDKAAALKALL